MSANMILFHSPFLLWTELKDCNSMSPLLCCCCSTCRISRTNTSSSHSVASSAFLRASPSSTKSELGLQNECTHTKAKEAQHLTKHQDILKVDYVLYPFTHAWSDLLGEREGDDAGSWGRKQKKTAKVMASTDCKARDLKEEKVPSKIGSNAVAWEPRPSRLQTNRGNKSCNDGLC